MKRDETAGPARLCNTSYVSSACCREPSGTVFQNSEFFQVRGRSAVVERYMNNFSVCGDLWSMLEVRA